MASGAEVAVYTWPTPNGHKIHIALEELGLPYRAIPVDIAKGDQFQPDFLKISPNNKVPALVDPDGPGGKPIALMESGAILIYLAEKTGKLWPKGAHDQSIALQWLCFQMANIGPMLGQVHHFRHYAPEPLPYAVERFTSEANRHIGAARPPPVTGGDMASVDESWDRFVDSFNASRAGRLMPISACSNRSSAITRRSSSIGFDLSVRNNCQARRSAGSRRRSTRPDSSSLSIIRHNVIGSTSSNSASAPWFSPSLRLRRVRVRHCARVAPTWRARSSKRRRIRR